MKKIEIESVWITDYDEIRCRATLKENNIAKVYVTGSLEIEYIKNEIKKYNFNDDDVKEVFKKHFYENFDKYIKLPKISKCSKLMQDVYDVVCVSDVSMCYITEEDWKNFYSGKYNKEDFENFKIEVKKYGFQHVIGIDDMEYKILGYSDLELKFNDDRYLKGKELEL